MQLAAAAAETATGTSWSKLFSERIAEPLGMSHTAYGHPMRDIGFEGNLNQVAESGVHTTLRDYSRFLEMIAGRGVFRGTRVLSEAAVAEMERDQTHGLKIGFTPPGARQGWDYGLGLWCEQATADLECIRVSSAGAFGAFPWIDRERDIEGVLLVVENLPRLVDRILATRELVERVVDAAHEKPAGRGGG
jgi:CubicO group peptidase (beta-lactamase class C family)